MVMPESSSDNVKGLFRPSNDEESLTKLRDMLERLGLGKYVDVRQEVSTKISVDDGVLRKVETGLVGTIPKSMENLSQEVRKKAREIMFAVEMDELEVGLCVGEKVSESLVLKDINGEAVKLFSMTRKGKPMVLLFHQYSNGASLETLFQFQQLADKLNQGKRKGFVEFVAISIDQSFVDFVSVPREILGENLTHLWAGEESWGSQIITELGVRSVPCYYLFDKFRVVQAKGHPGMDAAFLNQAIDYLAIHLPLTGVPRTAVGHKDKGKNSPSPTSNWDAIPETEQILFLESLWDTLNELSELKGLSVLIESTKTLGEYPCTGGGARFDTTFSISGRVAGGEHNEQLILLKSHIANSLPNEDIKYFIS